MSTCVSFRRRSAAILGYFSALELPLGEVRHLSLMEKYLEEIKTIRKDIARQRADGRKVSADIRRKHREIQTILGRVEVAF